jgi:hypothetical protein
LTPRSPNARDAVYTTPREGMLAVGTPLIQADPTVVFTSKKFDQMITRAGQPSLAHTTCTDASS